MTRLKKSIKLIIPLIFAVAQGYSQNLYDLDHSKKYAEFLFQSQQFKLAAMEFERINFMDPGNTQYQAYLVKSYRKSDQIDTGLEKLNLWYSGNINDTLLFNEYVKLNLLDHRYYELINSLEKTRVMSVAQKNYYHLSAILLQRDWDNAGYFIDQNNEDSWPAYDELCDLYNQQNEIKYKKPGLALAFSALVPGLGKVYSHDWKDGIISFLFVATNAYQAYRGFSRDGINSTYGWIFGSLSLGFYTGNLFGSWKSAKDYNFRTSDAIYHEIQNTVLDRF